MKTVLITGASAGIGEETVKLFSKKGWNVAATMRNLQKGVELSKLHNVKIFRMDVKDITSIKDCIELVIQEFGKIDVLVNNAGVYTTDPLEVTPDEIVDNIIDTNIKGVINVSKIILKYFRENKFGTIINISSIAGRTTFPFQTIYHSSKWAIEGLTEGLRYELKPLNIRLKLVEPGMVKTSLYDSLFGLSLDGYPTDYRSSFKNWYTSLMKNYKSGYSPALDAKTIYKAAISKSSKLRYTTDFGTRFILFLRSILPLSIFQKIVISQVG